jgi:hypothetical protein
MLTGKPCASFIMKVLYLSQSATVYGTGEHAMHIINVLKNLLR